MLTFVLFGIFLILMFTALIWSLKKLGELLHRKVVEQKMEFASANEMAFDPGPHDAGMYLSGFNLCKWGFGNCVSDVFQFSINSTRVHIGDFTYSLPDAGGGTVTFILIEDDRFAFGKCHFIDNRGLGANWFRKSIPWISKLTSNTFGLLKKNRWEIESNSNRLIIYRMYRAIPVAKLKSTIDDLEAILPDLMRVAVSDSFERTEDVG